jgi:antitoxin PrlF
MATVQSKITAQGQISVPAEIRRKLGVGPGSVIQWEEHDGQIVVRRAGKYTSEDVHRALFPDGPPKRKTLAELKEGLGQAIAEKYLRSQRARH